MDKNILYENIINEITSQGKFYINLGLERISAVLNLLDNPQDALKFIHVAGTNGKGSVCAMLSSVLGQKCKVGLYTSPHIFDYTERIKISGNQISKNDFAVIAKKVLDTAQKNDIHLTEFEILTATAFVYFKENKVDIAIMEVGLGGRLDATNVIKTPLCSIITNIDLDHTERLGNSIDEIAFEKAGIIKENSKVVVSAKNKGLKIIKEQAEQKNAQIYTVQRLNENYKLGLDGMYQKENSALVLKTLDIIPYSLSEEEIKKGLTEVKHICRFQYLEDKNIIIDGAHNPNGTELLRKSLDEKFPNQSFRFIFGCLRNKDYKKMVNNLFMPKDEVYFYHFSNPNSTTIDEIKTVCPYEIKEFSQYKTDDKKITVICGSFYMIKELLAKLGIKNI